MAFLRDTPVDVALGADHDIEIPPRLTRDLEAVAQSCRIQVLAVRGEWFADLDDGVRWFSNASVPERLALLGNAFRRPRVEQEIREALLRAYGVSEVVSIGIEFDSVERHCRVRWTTRTVWGDDVSGEQEV